MFRRKEENSDPSNPSAEMSAQPGSTYIESAAPIVAPIQSAPAPVSAAPTASSTYVPSAAAISRPTSEAVRAPAPPAAPAAASTYRPAPIAEFNRGAPRSTSEALRASAPAAPMASFASASEKSAIAAASKPVRRVLTVGNDILLKGEIATCDRLVIEGRVEAKLSDVHTVEIAEVGSFKGTAEVEDAEVSGVFEGDLIVRNRLVIYSSGEVRGNIAYGEIEIERGGKMTGQIKTVGGAAVQATKGKAFDADKHVHAKETAAA